MAGVITTGNIAAALQYGISQIFGIKYKQHQTMFDKMFDVTTSEKAYEIDQQFTTIGYAAKRAELQPVQYDTITQGLTVRTVHDNWSLGMQFSKESIDDNLYPNQFEDATTHLAKSMHDTIEQQCASVYNDAFLGQFFKHADGQPFISSIHTNITGGTFSNQLPISSDLSESALEDICIVIKKATNDSGRLISYMPQSLHIPVDQEFNAARILKSVKDPGTANNDINPIGGHFPKGVFANPYFTSTTAWFVRTDVPEKTGLKFYWREKPHVVTDNVQDNFSVRFIANMRFSLNLIDPRGFYGSNGP